MPTGKQRKISKVKNRKKKKSRRILFLLLIITAGFVSLVIFFVALFDYLYPPITGKGVLPKKREKQAVVLYFSDANERFLVPEKRYIPRGRDDVEKAMELVNALLEGSKKGLVNTFPENVNLQSIKIEGGGTAYVSFGKNLVKYHPGGSTSEISTVYSLTNTLTSNIPAIKKVKILIEGKEAESIKGHIDLRYPFTMNRELLAPDSREG
ncbi:MAG: GerMN domain-containing protein [Syntrophales bacterium]|nr:GerMN domain-containing protein [Syntrophales bacterium]